MLPLESLRCPICEHALSSSATHLTCTQFEEHLFPLVDGRPILINDEKSVFSISDFLNHAPTYHRTSAENPLKRLARAIMPTVSLNVNGRKNFARFATELLQRSSKPRVLVIGAYVEGEGFDALSRHPKISIIGTDVNHGEGVDLLCDIHDLPFADNSFDGVVVQAVLEHVVDPYRGIEEVHRVLKPKGLVYAETPFMQQVHGGRYDFTRFTFLGHRRVFRRFTQIDAGACCGTGMALAWSWQYFLTSLVRRHFAKQIMIFLAAWTSFFWKYFDYLFITSPGTLGAASGYYFMGQKSDSILSDHELLAIYDKIC